MSRLAELALLFAKMSLFAIGGATSAVPEMAREIVGRLHWLSPADFAQLFAIANAAPGPNVIVVTALGARVAGIAGGLVATLAMILPAGLLAIAMARAWERYRAARWRQIAQTALLPVTAGLLFAAAAVLVAAADTGWLTGAITIACAILSWRGAHPLWLLAGGLGLTLLWG